MKNIHFCNNYLVQPIPVDTYKEQFKVQIRMKIIITVLGLLNGGYMLLDGLFVLFKGKYIGPEKPGPWSNLFYKLSIDVFKLGPLFIFFGLFWLTWLYGLWTNQSWTYKFGLAISILTLWYLPVGTLFSIIILITLVIAKSRLGL
jgi:hypothetical protein